MLTVAAGINGRKETAYINANREQFPQGEAQNPNIIANAACDNLSQSTFRLPTFLSIG